MTKNQGWALCLSTALACFAVPAEAGYDMTRTPTGAGACVNESNSSMTHCYGTMAGIRNQTADGGRYVYFATGTTDAVQFTMVVNNVAYSCTGPSSMATVWRTAVAAQSQFFWITFDRSTGVCRSLSISGGSHYR
jgi:hypothetical protein